MPVPVVVEFLLKGMPAVQNAFRTVEQAATASERARTVGAQRGSRERVTEADKEAKAKIRAALKEQSERQKADAKATRDAERLSKQRTREADREMKALVRAAEESLRMRLSIEKKNDREMLQMKRDAIREEKKLLAEVARFEIQEDRERARAARERKRERDRDKRKEDREGERTGRTLSSAMGRGLSRGASTIARGATAAARLFTDVGGGFGLADSVQREVALTKMAGQISASSAIEKKDGKDFRVSTGEIVKRSREIGISQGMDPEDVAKGIGKFKDLTGKTSQALELMPELAKLSTAFGADISELAENAANIRNLFGDEASKSDIMNMLRVQTRQGTEHAVELKDMAKFGARLTAGAGLIETGGKKMGEAKSLATLSLMAQVAREQGGAASPAEASLAAQRFITDLQKNAMKVKKTTGIDVTTKEGGMRDPQEVIKEMVAYAGGDVTKLAHMGLGERGIRVLTGFNAISRKAGRGKTGLEAIDKTFQAGREGISDQEIEDRANSRLQDADKKLERSMIELRSAVGQQLLPALTDMVGPLRDAIPYITKFLQKMVEFAKWAEGNPWSAVFTVLAGSVAKEMAGAAIGKAAAGALSGSLGAAGPIGAAAALAIAAGIAAINFETLALDAIRNKSVGGSTNAFAEAKSIQAKIREGTASEADLSRLKVLKSAMQSQVEDEKKNVNNKSWTEAIIGGAGGLVSKDIDEANKMSQGDRVERLKQSQQALDELDKAMSAMLLRQVVNAKNGGTPPEATTGTVQRNISGKGS